jgi:DNA-binding CsgD family transcriptional regulator
LYAPITVNSRSVDKRRGFPDAETTALTDAGRDESDQTLEIEKAAAAMSDGGSGRGADRDPFSHNHCGDVDLPAGLSRLLALAAAMLQSRGIGMTLSMTDGTRTPVSVEMATARSCAGEIDALLTTSELRVARMVACGATNREISAQLGVSTKTIESHLTRIYHKLGARTRVELALRITGGCDGCGAARACRR